MFLFTKLEHIHNAYSAVSQTIFDFLRLPAAQIFKKKKQKCITKHFSEFLLAKSILSSNLQNFCLYQTKIERFHVIYVSFFVFGQWSIERTQLDIYRLNASIVFFVFLSFSSLSFLSEILQILNRIFF